MRRDRTNVKTREAGEPETRERYGGLVMPFLNMIEQTADINRSIISEEKFGPHFVLADHSLPDEIRAC